MIVGQTQQLNDTLDEQGQFITCVGGQGVMGFYDGRDPGSPDFTDLAGHEREHSIQQMIDLRSGPPQSC